MFCQYFCVVQDVILRCMCGVFFQLLYEIAIISVFSLKIWGYCTADVAPISLLFLAVQFSNQYFNLLQWRYKSFYLLGVS